MSGDRSSGADRGRGSIEHLRRLFEWNARANAAMAEAMVSAPMESGGATATWAHLLAAERIWLGRILGAPGGPELWPDWTASRCRSEAESLASEWRGMMESLTDGGSRRRVVYEGADGDSRAHSVEDLLVRVIAHSSHHRGEVALELRGDGRGAHDADALHAAGAGPIE